MDMSTSSYEAHGITRSKRFKRTYRIGVLAWLYTSTHPGRGPYASISLLVESVKQPRGGQELSLKNTLENSVGRSRLYPGLSLLLSIDYS